MESLFDFAIGIDSQNVSGNGEWRALMPRKSTSRRCAQFNKTWRGE